MLILNVRMFPDSLCNRLVQMIPLYRQLFKITPLKAFSSKTSYRNTTEMFFKLCDRKALKSHTEIPQKFSF